MWLLGIQYLGTARVSIPPFLEGGRGAIQTRRWRLERPKSNFTLRSALWIPKIVSWRFVLCLNNCQWELGTQNSGMLEDTRLTWTHTPFFGVLVGWGQQIGCIVSSLMSVRLWNFKDGPKKQDFWPRINIPKEFFLSPSMNYGSSKSAKIILSKSIFDVKNQLNLNFI